MQNRADIPAAPSTTAAVPASRRKNPISRVLDLVGNVWFGVTLLVLVFLYCWLGSAGLAPVYHWVARSAFELTEMEWYAWWPFQVLLALLSLSLIVVTIRRIPFNRFNLGVWTVHAGVLTLIAASAVYFGGKLEGDMLVYRYEAELTVGGAAPTRIIVRPGEPAQLSGGNRRYEIEVLEGDAHYTILSGEHKGELGFVAKFAIHPFVDGKAIEPFQRWVIAGHPEYTEDVIPGVGRAKKALGKAIIDPKLSISLKPAFADVMYLVDRPALLARKVGESRWSEMPLRGLPRYHEYAEHSDDVVLPPSERRIRLRRLSLVPSRKDNAGKLDPDLAFRVTGYLPYAFEQREWVPGGREFNPYVRFAVGMAGARSSQVLLAEQPGRDQVALAGKLPVRFRWIDEPAALQALLAPAKPELLFAVKDRGVRKSVPLARLLAGEVVIEGTDYRLNLVSFHPDWRLAAGKPGGSRQAVAVVKVEGKERSFTRAVVFPDATQSQDLDGEGGHGTGVTDPGIHLELVGLPSFVGVTLVGGAMGPKVVHRKTDGAVDCRPVALNESAAFLDGELTLTLLELSRTARTSLTAQVIPRSRRDPKEKDLRSMVQVEVTDGENRAARTWVNFSSYDGRAMGYHPEVVELEDGRRFELLFSRERYRLPAPVMLENFEVETYPGKVEARNYISTVRFLENGVPGESVRVSSNNPADHQGWWYYQWTYDPPRFNHSGLGVGNRHGVLAMLVGAFLIVLGSLYAFYVKPVLIRRRREGNARRPAARGNADGGVRSSTGSALRSGVSAGLILLGLLLPVGCGGGGDGGEPLVELGVTQDFARDVDLSRFRLAAVQESNRLKTVDSLAREKLKFVNAKLLGAVDPVLLYLDIIFAPERYERSNLISIRKKITRRDIVQGIRARVPPANRTGLISEAELERVVKTGRVSPAFLEHRVVRAVIGVLGRDLLRANRDLEKIHAAQIYSRGDILLGALKVIPPPHGDELDPWFAPAGGTVAMPADAAHAGVRPPDGELRVPGLQPVDREEITDAWTTLAAAWRASDAPKASAALSRLSDVFQRIKPDVYPESNRLGLEHWYYRNHKLTWTWIVYLGAVAFLLMAVVFGYSWARKLGLSFFVIGFLLHTVSIGIRWYLAGRIPNANMFEATMASSWFGCLVALILERVLRSWTLKSVPAFAASCYAMIAMMIGKFVPLMAPASFSTDISVVAPLLDRTVWLYIHTNLVIASYALIFFGGASAALYFLIRVAYDLFPRTWPRFTAAWLGATGDAPVRGGAASIILSGGPRHDMTRAGLAQTLDAATMIFMEIGFVTLWVGTVLGAIWADVSWGRPWGWDPKEVFALNTWIIFLILIHVRLKTKDKALWTALLAIFGCIVMLFNWYVVNFQIVGLHSYA